MGKKGFKGMGGMPNMGNMMKQAQKMQKEVEEKQKEMNEKEFEVTAGGGVVTVKINGKKEVLAVNIKEDVVDPEDIETLEDLVMAAMNEAIRTADETVNKEMEKITGKMNMPGLF